MIDVKAKCKKWDSVARMKYENRLLSLCPVSNTWRHQTDIKIETLQELWSTCKCPGVKSSIFTSLTLDFSVTLQFSKMTLFHTWRFCMYSPGRVRSCLLWKLWQTVTSADREGGRLQSTKNTCRNNGVIWKNDVFIYNIVCIVSRFRNISPE